MNIKLTHYNEQPLWLRENNYILSMHRAPTNSYATCFKSWFAIHTETINIWSHFIPCFFFMYLLYENLVNPNLLGSDKICLGSFIVGALICHTFSVCYHSFNCHSEQVSRLFKKLDYLGISLMIMMTLIPLIYYWLNSYGILAWTYLAGCVMMGSASIILSMSEGFSQPSYRPMRTLTFGAFGFYGVLPFCHWISLESHLFESNSYLEGALVSTVSMALIYLLATCLYASQLPEKLYPGEYDIFLHSHQIFHLLVTVGAIVHYHGLINLVDHVRSIKS